MPSKYLYRVQARRRNDSGNDVQRGLQVGQEVGKLLGGLAGAIKGAQADSMANKLMDQQSIGDQPGAGVTQSLGKLGDDGGPQPASGDGSAPTTQDTTPIDLGPMPSDSPMTPGPSGAQVMPDAGSDSQLQQALAAAPGAQPSSGGSDDALKKAMVASQLQSQPTAGGPQPAAQSPQSSTDFSLNNLQPSGPTNTNTVGSLIHTGGVAGMKMQQEFQKSQLADQLDKLKLQRAQRDATSAADEDAGTGRFALDAAQKRANLERTLAENAQRGKPKAKEIVPDIPVGQEPLENEAAIAKRFPTLSKLVGSDDTSVDTTSQKGYAVFGPKDKPDKAQKVPLADAQIYFKQLNARRKIQGLPLLRVPGEAESLGPMIGSTADNPYPAKNNLDAQSRASGTYILWNGSVKLVP